MIINGTALRRHGSPIIPLHKWQYFSLKDLFEIKGSKSFTKKEIKEYGEGKYPYNEDGNPNWEFMENYMKCLPYSGNFQEQKFL